MAGVTLNIEIPEELHRACKIVAASRRVTLKAFVVTALMTASGIEAYTAADDGAVAPG